MKQRQIRFRAWHKKQKRMFEVYGLGNDFITEKTLDGVSPGDNVWFGNELQDIEIMQFTGLKDKNGVDIYEGDVVETFGSKFVDEKWVEVRHVSVIEWWQSSSRLGYRLKNSKGKTMMIKPYALTNTMKAKVIGNIHQHNHLLK